MPFSWIYGEIMNFRNALFRRGVLESRDLGAPAISVGNITVGGTGKTPHVAFIAEAIDQEGEKVCILTRGYGRDDAKSRIVVTDGKTIIATPETAGDEPFELALKLQGKAVVIADADRVAAAEFAVREFGVTAFVLDDGFQHQRARRDLDIVLIDATDPFSNGRTLPVGRLREPLANLARADLFIISRTNLVEPDKIKEIRTRLKTFNAEAPVLESSNRFSAIRPIEDFKTPSAPKKAFGDLNLTPLVAFCALGNPENFFDQLRREGFQITDTVTFPDHHRFVAADYEKIVVAAEKSGAAALVTTAKDAVKLEPNQLSMPLYVAENSLLFDDEKKLREMIRAVCSK